MSKGWNTPDGQPANEPLHVMPIGDLRDHERSVWCPCMPTKVPRDATHELEEGEEWKGLDGSTSPCVDVIRHNSYDGRETGAMCLRALDALAMALTEHGHKWSPTLRDAYEHAIYLVRTHLPIEGEKGGPGA